MSSARSEGAGRLQPSRLGRLRHWISWTAGLAVLGFIIWYFQLSDFGSQIRDIGLSGFVAWALLTLIARSLVVETIVTSIKALGFDLKRSDAFWIGWVRTFANQIMPMLGLAIFASEIRRKTRIPWSMLMALSTPMLLYAASAVSATGIVAILSCLSYLGGSTIPMLLAFLALGGVALTLATHAAWLLDRLPGDSSFRKSLSADAFRRVAEDRYLIAQIIGLQICVILLRAGRIWLLFSILGADLSAPGALLITVIAEATALFQLTPGGLGLREGAIIGGATLLGISPQLGASVALVDRLFLVAVTTFLAIPGYWLLRRR